MDGRCEQRWGIMARRRHGGSLVAAAAVLLMVAVSPAASTSARPASGTTTRVSVSSTGAQANLGSESPALSADGRFVAFTSYAWNLVPGDTNGLVDVFVRDRSTGTTARVSVGPHGAQANGVGTLDTALSRNGRFVAFASQASNLVTGDTNGTLDAFVRDRWTGTTTRVSVGPHGAQADGGASSDPALSARGRFVAFSSDASNLVPGDTNGTGDVFVRDRWTGTTRRVSVSSTGTQTDGHGSFAPALSGDGRFVAFSSDASNLVPADRNGTADVFVRDRWTGTTRRVSVSSTGTQADGGASVAPALSGDGRFVAFVSNATNLVRGDTNRSIDVFVRDRWTGTTRRVSVSSTAAQANGSGSFAPGVSANGRFVAFVSDASNLVTGDTNGITDEFVRDRWTGTTRRVSMSSTGAQANGSGSFGTNNVAPALSAKGRFVAFASDATNLVPGDTNASLDVFVHQE
jgi:Tol biopolymer transport system component